MIIYIHFYYRLKMGTPTQEHRYLITDETLGNGRMRKVMRVYPDGDKYSDAIKGHSPQYVPRRQGHMLCQAACLQMILDRRVPEQTRFLQYFSPQPF